jgi:hypothetical protein
MPELLPIDAAAPHYQIGTSIDGAQYVLEVRWNQRDEAWYLDILDEDEDPIAHGIKIVLGSVLGKRCVDPRMPAGALIAADLSGAGLDATLDDLGTRVVVYYYSADEVAEVLAE